MAAKQLISVDPSSGLYRINPNVAAYLQSIEEPIAVIAAFGAYRLGKSYLLNYIQDGKPTFGVSNSTQSCTKGIFIAPDLIKVPKPDGSNVNVLLMDSEGANAVDSDSSHDFNILSLVCLLSSTCIYNAKSAIDSTSLQALATTVRVSDMLQSNELLRDSAPKLTWVARDFTLTTDGGDDASAYLEKSLDSMSNSTTDAIRSLFKKRECFLIPPPGCDPASSTPSPAFNSAMTMLKKHLLGTSRPKMIGNNAMMGRDIVNVTEMAIKALNSGAVPKFEGLWNTLGESAALRSHRLALSKLDHEIQAIQDPMDPSAWQSRLETLVTFTFTVFEEGCLKNTINLPAIQSIRNELHSEMTQKLEKATMNNNQRVEEVKIKFTESIEAMDPISMFDEDCNGGVQILMESAPAGLQGMLSMQALEIVLTKAQDLAHEKQALDRDVTMWKKKTEEIKAELTTSSKVFSDLTELKQMHIEILDAHSAEINQLKDRVHEAECIIEQSKHDLNTATDESCRLREGLSGCERAKLGLASKLEELKHQHEVMTTKVQALETRASRASAVSKRLRVELRDMEVEAQSALDAKGEAMRWRQQCEDLQETVVTLQTKMEQISKAHTTERDAWSKRARMRQVPAAAAEQRVDVVRLAQLEAQCHECQSTHGKEMSELRKALHDAEIALIKANLERDMQHNKH